MLGIGLMVLATFLALGAAVVHAGWNLAVKHADGDRSLLLWAQFLVCGAISSVALVAFGGLTWRAWPYALASGAVHIAYVSLLARSYLHGDLSLTYPIARGGGAVLAAVGGAAVLHDRLGPLAWIGIAVAGAGLLSFARPSASREALAAAGMLAMVIGTYSVIDGRGSRLAERATYVFGNSVADAFFVSLYGLARGRGRAMVAEARRHVRRVVAAGVATLGTSVLVLTAVRYAPVGYVSALRESSVVLAAFGGWRLLGEPMGRGRVAAACVVVAGLVLLVIGR